MFSGKEKQTAGDLQGMNLLDFGARMYDPEIPRWLTQDPLAERYYTQSPYVYCYNNPLKFIDPTGMEIEKGSQDQFNDEKERIKKEQQRQLKKISKMTQKGWSSEKLASRSGNAQKRLSSLSRTLCTMGKLESSSQMYRLTPISGIEGGLKLIDNVISIEYNGTDNFVHEVTHAGQFENGGIAFESTSIDGVTYGQDVFDELAAYKAQYAYDPSSVSVLNSTSNPDSFSAITRTWLVNITTTDGLKPYSPGSNNKLGLWPVSVRTGEMGLKLAYPSLVGPLGNFTIKDLPNSYYKK